MALSTDQQRVFNAICQFLKSDKQVFILQGSAGTGKTTLLAHLVKYLEDLHLAYQLMAPTGRAAHILKQKTGADASTIHRGIYDFEKLEVHINEADLADSDFKFHYPIKIEEEYSICIVDEGSMVGNHYSEGELWTFGTCRLLNDLTSYAKLDKKGKLIIIGDPAQLPPVKESVSLAMTSSYYEACGYKVERESLTEVFRQEETSEILRTASNIRAAIQINDFTRISLPEGEDITSLHSCDVARKYLELFPTPKLGNSVVICYSNATANLYNEQIRRRMYRDKAAHLQAGDIMMVVSNCYDRRKRDEDLIADCMDVDISCVQHHDVMNGEFVQVLEYGNQEVHTIPVYENKERILLPITFVDATVRLMSGKSHHCKMITEPILSAPRGTVSVTLLKALFIDFCMRNKELRKRPQSEEFKKAVQEDPYLNALRVRYGYSITGHKSQGGEWDSIFVDFDGVHYSEPGARWIYTAITRARKHLYTVNSVHTTPIHRLDIRAITRAANISEHYPSPIPVASLTSPFHAETDAYYLKNKYAEVAMCLDHSEYQVLSIEHLPYRERYAIRSAKGLSFRVDYMYKKNGLFSNPTITPNNPELSTLLSSPLTQEKIYPPLDYEPSNNTAQYLFEVMSQLCDDVQVDILNVVERLEHYQIIYCLNTASDYAWITFFVNAKGLITYGAPQAQDINDEKLICLIDKIQQLTEHSSPSSTSSGDPSYDCIHNSHGEPTESPKQRTLFFDTECNGLPASYHLGIEHTDNWPRLIQLAWIITDDNGNILKQQNHLVIPQGFIIQPHVEQLTGIYTTQALTQGKLLHIVLHEFITDLQMVDMVVGHNVDFDRHIVGCELYRSQMDYATMMSKPYICTMKQSTDYYHIQTGNDRYPKLMNLYQLLFHESFDNAHNALADVMATMKCYFELKKRLILP